MDATDMRYLELLSRLFPSSDKASAEIINLSAILNLPKGTEFFASDIHGEYEAFSHTLRNGSGSIRLKIDEYYVVPDTLRRFINYTTIQTGVNLAVTGIMWVGIALMAVSGTLGLIRKRRAAKGQMKD